MGKETRSFAVIFLLLVFLFGYYRLGNYFTNKSYEKEIKIRLGIKEGYQGVIKNIQLEDSLCISIAGVGGLIENPYPGIDYISIVEEGDPSTRLPTVTSASL